MVVGEHASATFTAYEHVSKGNHGRVVLEMTA